MRMVITQPAFNPLRLEWAEPAICFVVGGYSRWRRKRVMLALARKGENKNHLGIGGYRCGG